MKKDNWRVSKRRKACSACEEPFGENAVFFSALTRSDGAFERCDFCHSCWQEAPKDSFFSFWKARNRSQEEKKVDETVLEDLFWKLEAPENHREKAFRFVLALYLCRRKVFELTGRDRGEDNQVLLFQSSDSDALIRVEDPGLNDDQIGEVTAQIKGLLQMDL